MEEMLSLYDYLGKPAGKDLGKEVNTQAQLEKIPISMREVVNPKYKGKVMVYPKSFLDRYFSVSQVDDLPF
jgi:hypothetical protein